MSRGAVITNVQRYSLHDGPGLRTILFVKGCPLACLWCSNPETQKKAPEMLYSLNQCIACGSCTEVCSPGALRWEGEAVFFDASKCTDCGACAEECPTGAASMTGEEITLDDAVKRLEADAVFFRKSGGGVTISGGEPSVYPEFIRELLLRLKRLNIHTAVETCGYAEWDRLRTTVKEADLVLYDLKVMDPELHEEYTGKDNGIILENGRRIVQLKEVVFRMPVVPGYTDGEENFRAVAEYVRDLGKDNEVHLLPYHGFGTGKYLGLGRKYRIGEIEPPSDEEMERYRKIISGYHI
jgi:pyruvate formate lyase activating enzyme